MRRLWCCFTSRLQNSGTIPQHHPPRGEIHHQGAFIHRRDLKSLAPETWAPETWHLRLGGGTGGVGVVLLEPSGASFLYIDADGMSHVGPGTVISGSGGSMAAVTNFGGSFGVSLYNAAAHSTQMAATGCTP